MTKSKAKSKLKNSNFIKPSSRYSKVTYPPVKATNYIRRLYYWTLDQACAPYADWFIGFYSFLESIVIPLPTDPLLIARATAHPKKSLWVSFYVTLTSVLGGVAGYFVGFYFWESFSPFVYAYLFSKETFDLVVSGVHDSTFLFVFLGAFSPLPFKAFTLSAGSMSLPLLPFTLGCLLGRSIRFFTLGVLIFLFGDKIRKFIDKRLEMIFGVGGALVFIALVIKIGWF